MKMKILTAIVGVVLGGLAMGVHAAILSDSFTDGGLSDGTDAADTDWYGIFNNSSAEMPIVSDISGDNMVVTDTGSAYNTRLFGSFEDTSLSSAGDFLELTLNYSTVANATLADNDRVTWALFDDGAPRFHRTISAVQLPRPRPMIMDIS